MEALVRHTGLAVAIDRANIDTDQIIPKQFLKRVERSGFGQYLFFDWRYLPDHTPNPSFILNQENYRGASVLIAGPNFGCGSSREHAPWALRDYGFRVIIAPSFADIFFHNCFKNGMLPLVLSPNQVSALTDRSRQHNLTLVVDVQALTVEDAEGTITYRFPLSSYEQETLLLGLDDIARTLAQEQAILAYERQHG